MKILLKYFKTNYFLQTWDLKKKYNVLLEFPN